MENIEERLDSLEERIFGCVERRADERARIKYGAEISKARRYDRSFAVSTYDSVGGLRGVSIKLPHRKPTCMMFGVHWSRPEHFGVKGWDFRIAGLFFYFDIAHNSEARAGNGSILCALANRISFGIGPTLENADGGRLYRWNFFKQWNVVTEEQLRSTERAIA